MCCNILLLLKHRLSLEAVKRQRGVHARATDPPKQARPVGYAPVHRPGLRGGCRWESEKKVRGGEGLPEREQAGG